MINLTHDGKTILVHAFYHEGKAMFKGTPQHRKPLDMIEYLCGKTKPNYPVPAIRDVRTWDLWMLYRPYPADYVIKLRQSR